MYVTWSASHLGSPSSQRPMLSSGTSLPWLVVVLSVAPLSHLSYDPSASQPARPKRKL